MVKKKYNEEEGVWRTIGGRRVFIKTGQSLSSAMKESGKFKLKKKEEEKNEDKWNDEKYEDVYSKMSKENQDKINQLEEDMRKNPSSRNVNEKQRQAQEIYEYELYKKAMTDPDSIDPMTENSTDWEALDKKYKDRYISEEEPKDELKEISGGAVSTLQTTTPKSKADRLKPGTEIYYKGDNANIEGYFTVEKFEPEKEQYLASVTLKEKGGEGRTFKIGSQSIESDYGKEPGSRFSFKEDYVNYRNKIFEGYRKQSEERKAKEKVELSKQIAREIYGKGISDEVAERYGKDLIPLQEGTVTSELRDWEWDKDKMEWTKEALQNRLTYLTKGYDEAQKEGKKFEEAFEKKSLRTKYKGTFEYLEETTNMSGNEILELLKKIEQDKK